MTTVIWYVTRDSRPQYIIDGIGAYLTEKAANTALLEYLNFYGLFYTDDYNIVPCEIKDSYIGRNVLYMRDYRGYDYTINGNILDIASDIGVFPNLDALKQTVTYKDRLEEVINGDPDKYIQLPDGSIGCRDGCSNYLFTYGDCFEEKWSLSVKKLRVYKGDERDIDRHIRSLYKRYCREL